MARPEEARQEEEGREEEGIIVTPQWNSAASQRLDSAADDEFWAHLSDLNPGSPTHCGDNLARLATY